MLNLTLLSWNISIKINNTSAIIDSIDKANADFCLIQEAMLAPDKNVLPQYRSANDIVAFFRDKYPYTAFSPLFVNLGILNTHQFYCQKISVEFVDLS